MKSIFNKILFAIAITAFWSCTVSNEKTEEQPLKLWFEQPTQDWNEGLPIGNGSLGAMVYGTPAKEVICLNEESIWKGGKRYDRENPKATPEAVKKVQQMMFEGKYVEAEKFVNANILAERLPEGTMTYQMLANFFIERKGFESVTDYRRELDLNNAIQTTRFEKDGINYSRECFSSFPNKAMVIKYSANKSKAINLSAWIERSENTKIELTENSIHFSEYVGNGMGVKFHSTIHFETVGGTSEVKDGKLVVTDADELIIRVVAASDYRGGNPEQICKENSTNVLSKNYKELRETHVADYRSLFKRLDFQISESNGEDLPTDKRLEKVKKTNTADNYLTQLQYQFGRYLLISSSRPGTMPANLQGIWVDGLKVRWNADYHININIQMNYWIAEMTNLTECHEPFLKFIGDLREMGRITARKVYGCRGFVAHHTTDAWLGTAPFGKAGYGMWPMGAAWCCQHLFTHYQYTEDKEYLAKHAYPIMKEAAQFFVDFMVPEPKTGYLVTSPSMSPENRYLTEEGKKVAVAYGCAMDRSIVLELYRNCIASAEILGIDQTFRDTLQSQIEKIKPLQIGSDGRLMEWMEEFKEKDPGHRHISHLYALHPSNQISKARTPDLFDAAKKTIEHRLANGGGHTGWSRAWIINFWARLLEPQKAHENIIALQRKSTLPNLLDVHPPFQIDGNFGVVSGVTEMLMQSHDNEIFILPALPVEWSKGSINGLLARKGFEVDLEWENSILKSVTIKSKLGNNLQLRYGDIVVNKTTQAGDVLKFNSKLEAI